MIINDDKNMIQITNKVYKYINIIIIPRKTKELSRN